MKINISNFRGLADLRANAAPLLLLAGSNGAGKSSACMAIAAAASGALLPEGLTKKAAGLLVRGHTAWHWSYGAALVVWIVGAAASTMLRRRNIRAHARTALRESADWPQRLAQARG